MMTSRFAYANEYQSVEEYEAAIAEAWGQADGLSEQSERLAAEAERWEDRALTLEMELENFEYTEWENSKNV